MPRGNPGKLVAFRLDPALIVAVQERTPNLKQAVEEGLGLWLAREKRKAKGDPPATREIAGRKGATA